MNNNNYLFYPLWALLLLALVSCSNNNNLPQKTIQPPCKTQSLSTRLNASSSARGMETADAVKVYGQLLDSISSGFLQVPLDSLLAQQWSARYLDSIDPLHLLLLEGDVARIHEIINDHTFSPRAIDSVVTVNRISLGAIQRVSDNFASWTAEAHPTVGGISTSPFSGAANNERELASRWRLAISRELSLEVDNGRPLPESRALVATRYSKVFSQLQDQLQRFPYEYLFSALVESIDPDSRYIQKAALADFSRKMALNGGAGVSVEGSFGKTYIKRLIPGSVLESHPWISKGDQIIGLEESEGEYLDLVGYPADKIAQLLGGCPGTEVRLTIRDIDNGNRDRTIAVERKSISLGEQSVSSRITTTQINDQKVKFGLVSVPSLYMDFDAYRRRDPEFKAVSRDLLAALKSLSEENILGMVLDLRGNGGGSLFQVMQTADLFLEPGSFAYTTKGNSKELRPVRTQHKAAYKAPIVVLIDGETGGGAEILAAALQDFGRAIVVGERSFGLGLIHKVTPLEQGTLKFASESYLRATGVPFHNTGVNPDISLAPADDGGRRVTVTPYTKDLSRNARALDIDRVQVHYNLDRLKHNHFRRKQEQDGMTSEFEQHDPAIRAALHILRDMLHYQLAQS